jgi:hypothetical protein
MKQGKLWHGVVYILFAIWATTQFDLWTLGEVIK